MGKFERLCAYIFNPESLNVTPEPLSPEPPPAKQVIIGHHCFATQSDNNGYVIYLSDLTVQPSVTGGTVSCDIFGDLTLTEAQILVPYFDSVIQGSLVNTKGKPVKSKK